MVVLHSDARCRRGTCQQAEMEAEAERQRVKDDFATRQAKKERRWSRKTNKDKAPPRPADSPPAGASGTGM